jgi:hypothetical protein
MASTEVDSQNGTRLPAQIRVSSTMTPNEMRALKVETGRPLSDLLGGDAEDMDLAPDRIQALVWVALRRAGHRVSWEDAGDVLPDMSEAPPDPTKTGSSSSSSISAAGGE